MGVIVGYDVQRLTPAGPVTRHYGGKIETDGVWLIAYAPNGGNAELIAPAHAIVSAVPCEGECGHDGE